MKSLIASIALALSIVTSVHAQSPKVIGGANAHFWCGTTCYNNAVAQIKAGGLTAIRWDLPIGTSMTEALSAYDRAVGLQQYIVLTAPYTPTALTDIYNYVVLVAAAFGPTRPAVFQILNEPDAPLAGTCGSGCWGQGWPADKFTQAMGYATTALTTSPNALSLSMGGLSYINQPYMSAAGLVQGPNNWLTPTYASVHLYLRGGVGPSAIGPLWPLDIDSAHSGTYGLMTSVATLAFDLPGRKIDIGEFNAASLPVYQQAAWVAEYVDMAQRLGVNAIFIEEMDGLLGPEADLSNPANLVVWQEYTRAISRQ